MSTETNEYPNDEEPKQDGHPAALLGSYALGTLDPAEMELVTRHVQRCPACRAELAAYDDVVSLLPYAAPVYQVPVRARAGLLARLDEIGTSNTDQMIIIRPPARERWSLRTWLNAPRTRRAAAFAAVPLVVILAIVSIMANVINDQQEQLATIEAEQGVIEKTLLDTGTNEEPAQATFISSTSAPAARAKLIVNYDTNSALILARDLPKPGEGQQYVAWLRMDDVFEYARAGILELDDDRRARLTVEPQDTIANYTEVIVTLESDPDVATPTGPQIMTAAVSPAR